MWIIGSCYTMERNTEFYNFWRAAMKSQSGVSRPVCEATVGHTLQGRWRLYWRIGPHYRLPFSMLSGPFLFDFPLSSSGQFHLNDLHFIVCDDIEGRLICTFFKTLPPSFWSKGTLDLQTIREWSKFLIAHILIDQLLPCKHGRIKYFVSRIFENLHTT